MLRASFRLFQPKGHELTETTAGSSDETAVMDIATSPTSKTPISSTNPAYRVLARKYRPVDFSGLIGQDALVRTLSNAIRTNRIAHAYMLTGVRGVGKTSTARIIAKALNYVGPDGSAAKGPSLGPFDDCPVCKAITEDRHVDVLEMDAATRTGVDDIRELLDGVRYGPVEARYKIYIIDEVHMLSKAAFNALLKTLEEPPEHVKFIFATTEIRKVPVTVLSRCQRFDLRRVPVETLAAHFGHIAKQEGVTAQEEAIHLIARAADGSVRDGLSLLDQAIALQGDTLSGEGVRDMLGLADRQAVLDVFEALMQGNAKTALEGVERLHAVGADPLIIMQDLLDVAHMLTRLKAAPELANAENLPEAERTRGMALADKLRMPVLARAWQILLKGIQEIEQAPVPMQALEMALLRLIYAADMPPPADLIKKLQDAPGTDKPGPGTGTATSPASPATGGPGPSGSNAGMSRSGNLAVVAEQPQADSLRVTQSAIAPEASRQAVPMSFASLVEDVVLPADPMLASELKSFAHLVSLSPGRLEIRLEPQASRDLSGRLTKLLCERTEHRWVVSLSSTQGDPTLLEQRNAAIDAQKQKAAKHPVVRAFLDTFKDADVYAVRDLSDTLDPGLDPGDQERVDTLPPDSE